MNLFHQLKNDIEKIIVQLNASGALPGQLDLSKLAVEPPRDASHGDVACNAAMILTKQVGQPPAAIAEKIAADIKKMDFVTEVKVVNPGFINIRLQSGFWQNHVGEILKSGVKYGLGNVGQGKPVNVEYVSANPTGPMHVGHGRGAVVGDSLARLLAAVGYKVTKEYYINDAGSQVDTLARSLHMRYREQFGENIGEIPKGLYPGEYLIDVAKKLAAKDGKKWLDKPESDWLPSLREYAVAEMMNLIRDDLKALGVEHDVFTSEKKLVMDGDVDKALQWLTGKGLVYQGVLEPPKGKKPDDWEPREQTLFRATNFGDEIDRPLKKSDGSYTYFANDIACHYSKFSRGFNDMINIWGADHGGYVKRMQSAVKAISEGKGDLDVKLVQMIGLYHNGEPVKMSKRAGTFVTLREVVDEVGKDVFRFIIMTRKNDIAFDFDLAKVKEQSKDNPVFYVQYAHARIRSVMRHAAEMFGTDIATPESLQKANYALLTDSDELALIKLMATYPRLVESAALSHEPHRVGFYLHDLAAAFHSLWNKGRENVSLRFLLPENRDVSLARLAMLEACRSIIASGLGIFGVTPVEEMGS